MRDLEAIRLNLAACVLRARINAHRTLENQLRQVTKLLVSASATSSLTGSSTAIVRPAQLVELLAAAAERASSAGDAALGADIERAASDLRAWYRLGDGVRK